MQREIKPEDVTRLIREGKLEFGKTVLEFSNSNKFDPAYAIIQRDKLTGFSIKNGHMPFESEKYSYWNYARFPLPALRDGDPVVVEGFNHRIFAGFRHDNNILCYLSSKWESYKSRLIRYADWRLPTKQELSEAGYTEDQINEMTTRWGTETPRNQTHKAWQQSANGTVRVG